METDDIATIILRHENGAYSELHMDFLRQDKSRGMEIIGEKGTIEWRSVGKNPERAMVQVFDNNRGEPRLLWQAVLDGPDAAFTAQRDLVLAAVAGRRSVRSNIGEAVAALAVVEAMGEHNAGNS